MMTYGVWYEGPGEPGWVKGVPANFRGTFEEATNLCQKMVDAGGLQNAHLFAWFSVHEYVEVVRPGQIWTYLENALTFQARVVKPNDSVEAGEDSWVMEGLNGGLYYMHHKPRIAGIWSPTPIKIWPIQPVGPRTRTSRFQRLLDTSEE